MWDLNFRDLYSHHENIPISHMTHVDKLFPLHQNVGVAIFWFGVYWKQNTKKHNPRSDDKQRQALL